jgi:hypothetical protein
MISGGSSEHRRIKHALRRQSRDTDSTPPIQPPTAPQPQSQGASETRGRPKKRKVFNFTQRTETPASPPAQNSSTTQKRSAASPAPAALQKTQKPALQKTQKPAQRVTRSRARPSRKKSPPELYIAKPSSPQFPGPSKKIDSQNNQTNILKARADFYQSELEKEWLKQINQTDRPLTSPLQVQEPPQSFSPTEMRAIITGFIKENPKHELTSALISLGFDGTNQVNRGGEILGRHICVC